MGIILERVTKDDIETVWKMQIEAFSDLLEKYRDYDTNPGAENFEKVLNRFEQPWTVYYFLVADGQRIGAVRVIDRKDGSRKRISPMWIMAEYRNKGYAQQAIAAVEDLYGSDNWCLETIKQEAGNCYLYEKMGYHRTGEEQKINESMDLVFYEKD